MFDREPFALWKCYLGELRGDIFTARLQKLQNLAARIITGSDYDTPAEPLIEEQGWKTVRELIQNDTSVMMYKSMNNMAPTYLSNLFTCSSQFHL